jgi:hypothetical protein
MNAWPKRTNENFRNAVISWSNYVVIRMISMSWARRSVLELPVAVD